MSSLNQNDLGLTDASCSCGSQTHKSERTAESGAVTTTFHVSGMTCSHCVKSVTAEVGRVPGAETVDVELVPGGVSLVTVSSAGPLNPAAVAAAVDEAGYELVTATP
ncbi:copper chaperone [Cryobacterium sp. TMT1-21]|uniref:Copper chaperone n=1 Tax=Cryobacterium shii TaxID=1259235 RepID=A0AAQ2C3J2_9MICO|nr:MULTISPECIES: heavy-metal-associated domain-containing protein [Cryobacterium]TFC41770.1 copper chaperone [Cryobacterium shii]TFC84463.1 copper chaperone [Cryobacterium sp. TmT2-59]TFD15373.1 copper chaperone [Cryobacterium sp. TMT4-10]TFD17547.1 copper chaperone [Cryobacterium sp. TMT1-21]TFD21024.1 copper chaperone [Cryobacterium sp. TMT2-23]